VCSLRVERCSKGQEVDVVWPCEEGDEDRALGRVVNVEVESRSPPGRPKKSCRKYVDKDLATLGVDDEDALDRARWRKLIKTSNPLKREKLTKNGR
jgi:hypothetical protein